ncbi:MAG: hypothetical protein AB7P04_00785 [Bacteriovoracia bacterium]
MLVSSLKERIIIVLMAGAAIAAVTLNPAYASRSKVLVSGAGDGGMILGGTGSSGSLYTDSVYNMFYNPSYINDYGQWAIIEKTNGTAPGGGAAAAADGGFVMAFANVNFGFFFNRVDGTSGFNVGSFNNRFNFRPFDFTLGADMGGVKWGLGLTYGGFKGATITDKDLQIRLGAQWAGLDPFIGFTAVGNGNVGGTDTTVKDFTAGLRYHWGEWLPYFAYMQNSTGGNVVAKNWGIGFGRNTRMSDVVKLDYSVGFWRATQASTSRVPFSLTVEGKLTSWCALRGGVQYNFLDQTNGVSNADSTKGRIGASFFTDGLSLDWALGNIATQASASEAGRIDSTAFALDSALFTSASLTYKW